MRKYQWGLLAGFLTSIAATTVPAAPTGQGTAEIVVAIRYLQQTGTSHAHLFLFQEDGKLLRQLTKDDGGQDHNPIFAPDGETIVFTRDLTGGAKQWWSVEPRGGNLRRLDAAPDWYKQAKDSPRFEYPPETTSEPSPIASATPAPTAGPKENPDETRRVFPLNDTAELALVQTPEADRDIHDEWYARLRGKTGHETTLGKMSGWAPTQLLYREGGAERSSLHEGAWQVTFISTSLGSTDSATVYAVGPGERKLVRLARNWAAPFPLPGEAAFLTFAEERYVPFGDGAHTANCSYADRWDAGLKRVRYARKDAAATCNGASMYRPGKTPAVVTMLTGEDTDK